MDRMVYTALSGLKGQMSAQAAIANNIANASTTGFRADRVAFQQMMLKGGSGLESPRTGGRGSARCGSPLGYHPGDRPRPRHRHSGHVVDGRAGHGRLRSLYPRGDLKITKSGVLETGDGFPVMGSGGPITVPPAGKVMIAEDGTLSIMAVGAAPGSAPQVIDRIRLANPEGSQTVKGLDNLLRVKGGGVLPDDLDAKVITGSLEGSNVNLTQALVDMIENQRSYEVQANLLKEAKSMDEISASLMRLPG